MAHDDQVFAVTDRFDDGVGIFLKTSGVVVAGKIGRDDIVPMVA